VRLPATAVLPCAFVAVGGLYTLAIQFKVFVKAPEILLQFFAGSTFR
jgi:hypothetical protein